MTRGTVDRTWRPRRRRQTGIISAEGPGNSQQVCLEGDSDVLAGGYAGDKEVQRHVGVAFDDQVGQIHGLHFVEREGARQRISVACVREAIERDGRIARFGADGRAVVLGRRVEYE